MSVLTVCFNASILLCISFLSSACSCSFILASSSREAWLSLLCLSFSSDLSLVISSLQKSNITLTKPYSCTSFRQVVMEYVWSTQAFKVSSNLQAFCSPAAWNTHETSNSLSLTSVGQPIWYPAVMWGILGVYATLTLHPSQTSHANSAMLPFRSAGKNFVVSLIL